MGITVRNLNISGRILGKDFIPGPPPAPPPPPVPADSRYNVLMLPGTGTNGGTNNTFIDSSTNNFTVTRVGNATQCSFSPFSTASGYWSNYFDGASSTLLSFPSSSSAYNLSGTAWTVECWIYPQLTTFSDGQSRFLMGGVNRDPTAWNVAINSNYALSFAVPYDGIVGIITAENAVKPNQWSHVAVVRSGSSTKIYINGVESASSNSVTLPASANIGFKMGYDDVVTVSTRYIGYVSNLRINTTTALYNTNFTPSTTPLTAVSGTSLLACQNNRFMDGSSNNLTITAVGNTKVSAYGPFDATSTYNSSTMGGSMYFDGGEDWCTTPNVSAFDLSSSSVPFTIEAWVYNAGGGTYRGIIGARQNATVTGWCMYIHPNNTLYMGSVIVGNAYTDRQMNNTVIPPNTWAHIALVKTTAGYTAYVNGVAGTSVNLTGGLEYKSEQPLIVGALGSGGEYPFCGYISNLRIVKGIAVYTTNFTPPTAPVSNISGTSLLLNGTNAAIVDTSAKNNLETVGSAQISTTQSKFGGGSIYLPTNGSKLTIPPSDLFAYGTGAFTIEAWIYPTQSSNGMIFGQNRFLTNYLMAGIDGNGTIFFTYGTGGGGTGFFGTSGAPLNTWTHLAWVREGTGSNQFKMYVNGTLSGTETVAQDFNDTTQNTICVGNYQHANQLPFYGYINDLRITKGLARYTGNFTPPTQL